MEPSFPAGRVITDDFVTVGLDNPGRWDTSTEGTCRGLTNWRVDGPAPTVPGGRGSICGDFLMSPPLGLGSEAGSDDGDNHPLSTYIPADISH
jgi:hypothetical protein